MSNLTLVSEVLESGIEVPSASTAHAVRSGVILSKGMYHTFCRYYVIPTQLGRVNLHYIKLLQDTSNFDLVSTVRAVLAIW